MANELDAYKNALKSTQAQLDAAKQMLNESASSNLQARTNFNILLQTNKELGDKVNELKAQLEAINNKCVTDSSEPLAE
jgi:uncharacterized protein YukE